MLCIVRLIQLASSAGVVVGGVGLVGGFGGLVVGVVGFGGTVVGAVLVFFAAVHPLVIASTLSFFAGCVLLPLSVAIALIAAIDSLRPAP